jgi:NhaP-type Na+/H+ or K+/H+ antiporter
MRDTIKVLIIFGIAFLFDYLETILKLIIPFSSLIAILSLGLTVLKLYPVLADRLVKKFSKIWVFSEMILFVLIGALVNITIISKVGLNFGLILVLAIIIRFFSVYISTWN